MNHTKPPEPPSLDRGSAYRRLLDRRKTAIADQLAKILQGKSRFVWEVGCGHGHFLTAFAQAHPETLCLGIDIASDRIDRGQRKRDRANLANLHFLHAEARLFLNALPAGVSIAEIFILFPDPWPKARHHKHRILQPDFLAAAADRSTADARLCFRTDFPPYFDDATAAIRRHPQWQEANDRWPFEFDTVFQSRAERYQSLIARRTPSPPP